jgi:hypothetical protein
LYREIKDGLCAQQAMAGRAWLIAAGKLGNCDDRRKGFSVLARPEATSKNASRKSNNCRQLNLVHAAKGEHSNTNSGEKQLLHVPPRWPEPLERRAYINCRDKVVKQVKNYAERLQTMLAVIMHRIWVDGTEFRWTREVAAAWE